MGEQARVLGEVWWSFIVIIRLSTMGIADLPSPTPLPLSCLHDYKTLNAFRSSRLIIYPSAKRLWIEIRTVFISVSRNLYLWPLNFGRVSDIRQICHFTCKNNIKIISLMSKTQYRHVQN
jgi:hypothetical protein